MARPDRPPPHHLSFLRVAAEQVRRWGLFPLLRGMEARAHGLPRIGRARLPSQNIADLAQTPALGFADSTLDEVTIAAGRARISGSWFGLMGPMGPLPTHLTEFAFYERRYAKQRPFGRFLDLIAGRSLQFFYRAWADSQPVTMIDRPGEDRFADYVAALSGARQGAAAEAAFPANARLHYAALFASRRSASAIEDGLAHLLGQPVRVLEYQPRWRALEPEDCTRLGRAPFNRLGGNAMLGTRACTASDAFRVVVRARSARDYRSLLPTGKRFAIAMEALNALAPSHLEWDLQLEIAAADAAPARLDGTAALGWSSWMRRPGDASGVRDDAHLRPLPRLRARLAAERDHAA